MDRMSEGMPWDDGPIAESREEAIGLFVRQAMRLRNIAAYMECSCGMHYSKSNPNGRPVITKGQSFGLGRCQRCYTLQDFDERLEELWSFKQ